MTKTPYLILALFLILAFGITACGGSGTGSQYSSSQAGPTRGGKDLYNMTCMGCHGLEGEGFPGLAKDMTASEFVATKNDDELVDFIKVGREHTDALNTTGVEMPPKGGNPTLSDEDLAKIVAFVRTLQK